MWAKEEERDWGGRGWIAAENFDPLPEKKQLFLG